MENDDLANFGNVEIILKDYPSHQLFSPFLRNMTVTTVISQDYRDYSGIHG